MRRSLYVAIAVTVFAFGVLVAGVASADPTVPPVPGSGPVADPTLPPLPVPTVLGGGELRDAYLGASA
jgi:hypothetical protein